MYGQLVDFQVHKDLRAYESSFLDLQRLSHLAHGLDDMACRLQAAAALCLESPGSWAQVRRYGFAVIHRSCDTFRSGAGLAAMGMQLVQCC